MVLASRGYPGATQPGPLPSLHAAKETGAEVVQAATSLEGSTLMATGGRVLTVSATGATVAEARAAAYRGVDAVGWADGFCRRDIGG